MNKFYLPIILFCLLAIIFVPFLIKAEIVPQSCGVGNIPADPSSCPGDPGCPCGINDFFTMLGNIYSFIVIGIATPLAVIAITIGGILIMTSAGNPNLMGTGKKILYSGIIGLVLVFCSWLIINFVLTALGYTGTWSSL